MRDDAEHQHRLYTKTETHLNCNQSSPSSKLLVGVDAQDSHFVKEWSFCQETDNHYQKIYQDQTLRTPTRRDTREQESDEKCKDRKKYFTKITTLILFVDPLIHTMSSEKQKDETKSRQQSRETYRHIGTETKNFPIWGLLFATINLFPECELLYFSVFHSLMGNIPRLTFDPVQQEK